MRTELGVGLGLALVACVGLALPSGPGGRQRKDATASEPAGNALVWPRLQPGQVLANIFSRTIAFKAEGLEIAVRRTSGTGIYTVTESSPDKLLFNGVFLYDGRPESRAKTEIREHGRTVCYDDKCSPSTDASGLLYNARIWGDPPPSIRKGTTWEITISDPWELGPPGKQTMTVISVDPINHSMTLKRDGSGEGFFADDKKQIPVTKDGKNYTADVTPGPARWSGYTTFRDGIVISDELLVERPVTLSSAELGKVQGGQREYILLNAMPPPSAPSQ
jgi:hypothetical protein